MYKGQNLRSRVSIPAARDGGRVGGREGGGPADKQMQTQTVLDEPGAGTETERETGGTETETGAKAETARVRGMKVRRMEGETGMAIGMEIETDMERATDVEGETWMESETGIESETGMGGMMERKTGMGAIMDVPQMRMTTDMAQMGTHFSKVN